MLEGTLNKFHFHRLLFRLLNLGESEDNESGNEDSHSNVHCRSGIDDSGFLCNFTDESTDDNIYGNGRGAVESTTNLNQLVTTVAAATEDIEQRIHNGVEHTHAETGDKCTDKINPHACHGTG